MRNILTIILLLLYSFFIYTDEILNISKEILTSTNWGPENKSGGTYLFFYEDNSYEYKVMAEGGEIVFGKYEIGNNSVLLKPIKIIPDISGYIPENKILLYKKSINSVIFENYLEIIYDSGDIQKFWNYKTEIKKDTKIKYNNINVIVLEKKDSEIIKNNVFIRDYPNLNGKKFLFKLNNEKNMNSYSYFLPEGTQIKILCRTIDREKIKDFNNYWYYVIIELSSWDKCKLENQDIYYSDVKAWIYGEFINLK